jgi:hypothetical protein
MSSRAKFPGKLIAIFGFLLILAGTLFPYNFSFDENRTLRNSFGLASSIESRGHDLLIGVDAVQRQPFKGKIDDIRIYRRAMTPAEIVDDANSEDLVASFSFDETSGMIASDSSGNGNHGSLVNDPERIAGRRGGALRFVGAGQYVRVPNSPSIDVSDENITVSMWIVLEDTAGRIDQVMVAKPWRSNSMRYPFYQYAVEFDANGRKSVDFYFGDTTRRLRGPFSVRAPAGVWTHVVFAYDGRVVRGYVDGEQQVTRGIRQTWNFRDLVVNLMLFVPFGFGLAIVIRDGGFSAASTILSVLAIGALVSLGVEILQAWLPGRYSSFVDVAANGIGALAGSAWHVFRRNAAS